MIHFVTQSWKRKNRKKESNEKQLADRFHLENFENGYLHCHSIVNRSTLGERLRASLGAETKRET